MTMCTRCTQSAKPGSPVFSVPLSKTLLLAAAAAAIVSLLLPAALVAQAPAVTALTPARNALNVERSAGITVSFSMAMNATTFTNGTVRVNGSLSGLHTCTIGYNQATFAATITPTVPFRTGDVVNVLLTRKITSAAGDSLARPLTWGYTVKSNTASAQFRQSSTPGAGVEPEAVTAADLDGDGDIDLAVADAFGRLQVLLNNGNGTFVTSTLSGVATSPESICAADLDGDGDIDLAMADYWTAAVEIFLNNGNGTFVETSTPGVGGNPYGIAAGDFDGDGDIDLAASSYASNAVFILTNNGSGAFTVSSVGVDGTGAYALTTGDFDADGDLDIVVTNSTSNTITVLLNNGSGAFSQSANIGVGSRPYWVSAADLDGDGDLDLAVANWIGGTVSILMNNGSGTFASSSTPGVGSRPFCVAPADLDGDGDLDLVTANYASNSVSLLLNAGNGTFTPGTGAAVGITPYGVAAGDFDGDGVLDLATVNSDARSVSILKNINPPTVTGFTPTRNALNVQKDANITAVFSQNIDNATFTGATVRVTGSLSGLHPCTFSYNPGTHTATIDPNADFRVGEVVRVTLTRGITSAGGDSLLNAYGWNYTIIASRAGGTFTLTSTAGGVTQPRSMTAADLDGDGDIDLAVANTYAGSLSIMVNGGSGTFTQSSTPGAGTMAYAVTAGDFDADGDIDLAVANRDSNRVSILLNNGSGSFARSSIAAVGAEPLAMTAGDFDCDGDLDLAVVNYGANSVSILLNNGSGTFVQSSTTGVGDRACAITAGDFDGDGDLDLAVVNLLSKNISILVNNGKGVFTQSSAPGVEFYPIAITSGDLDGDGDVDLAVSMYSGAATKVLVLSNNGSGAFTQTSTPGDGNLPQAILPNDLDGDGDLDLAVVNYNSSTVTLHANDGSGAFAQTSGTAVGSWPTSMAAGDFDGDGDIDLATANLNANSVSILKNVPRPPIGLLVADSSSQTVTLRWRRNAESSFLRYRIYGGTSSGPTTKMDSTTAGIGDTMITLHGLTNRTTYYFRLTAIDNTNYESPYSTEVSATPKDIVAPDIPLNLVVTDSSSRTVRLAWRQNAEADFLLYRIYRGTSPNPAAPVDSMMGGITDTAKTFTGLADGTRYYFRVTAVDSGGNESGFSNEVSAIPQDRFAPAPPQNLAVRDSSSRSITIVWRMNGEGDFLRYRIYQGTSPNPAASVDSTMGGHADTAKTFTGLLDGTRYYFRVTAVDSFGNESGYSNEVSASPADRVAPAAPQNLLVTDSSGQSIAIRWRMNAEGDFLRYRIYRGTSPNPATCADSTAGGRTDTSAMLTGLSVGTRYYFRITAVDSACNEGGYSNEVDAVPQTTIAFMDGAGYAAPGPLSHTLNSPVGRFRLTAAAHGATLASLKITLTGSFTGVTGVKLWSSVDSVFGGDLRVDSVAYSSSPVTLSGNASAIDTGGTYYFVTVDLGASTGTIAATIATSADVVLTAGSFIETIADAPLAANPGVITQIDGGDQLAPRVFALSQNYPNPFNPTTTITFTLAEDGIVSLKVFDILGREVVTLVNAELKAGVVHHATLDASRLASGAYFYRLDTGKNVQVKRLLLLK